VSVSGRQAIHSLLGPQRLDMGNFALHAALLLVASCLVAAEPAAADTSMFHVIISTDCSPYSDWMSEGLIYTHYKTGTKGNITRISSCDDPTYVYPRIWHPRMTLQETPNYQKQTTLDGKEDNYPIYNKPMGIDYWLKDKGRDLHPDTVVVMMDTDMLIGMPLEEAFQDQRGQPIVKHGTPAGQIYLLGHQWFDRLNCLEILRAGCGDSCVDTTAQDVERFYMVGAPYALTRSDWARLAPLWTKYTLRARPVSKGWADDMYGYILAAMHLGLRHATTTALMLSDGKVNYGEAWHLIDGMDPEGKHRAMAEKERYYRPLFKPTGYSAPILHYCQSYHLRSTASTTARLRFSKYEFGRAPLGHADCSPMADYPYDDRVAAAQQSDPTATPLERREAYMMQKVAWGIYEALIHYRLVACSQSGTSVPPAAPIINSSLTDALTNAVAEAQTTATSDDLFHVIISTDCSPYSDWMSEGLIYTHYKTGTKGNVTRISSCNDTNYVYPRIWHPRMTLQVTPNYQRQTTLDGKVDNYPIYNKPMGIDYWLNDKGRDLHPDTVVVMMDTDMLLQVPLEQAFIDRQGQQVVKHGTPAGQVYLIGSHWFDRLGCQKMMEAECGNQCHDTTSKLMAKYYMVGAPYAMTHADWVKLTPLWTKYTLRVRPVSKGWADDMFGYVLAAMHFGLRHATTTSLMVSNAKIAAAEAWHFVAGLDPQGRAKAKSMGIHYTPIIPEGGQSAPILHYCQTYSLEKHGTGGHYKFSKYEFERKPMGTADCTPMPKYKYDNSRVEAVQKDPNVPAEDQKHAYMLRAVASGLHEALSHYRTVACSPDELEAAARNGPPEQKWLSEKAPPRRQQSGRAADTNKAPLFGTKRHRDQRDTL